MKKQFTALVARLLIFPLVCFHIFPSNAGAFSVGDEKKVGEKLLSIVRQEFDVLDDPDISEYINNLGGEVLQVAGPQFFDYHFFVINDKEFNAFAAPSGLIFIHSGIIDTMDSEEELLSVLAHECAHVTSRHIADRIRKSTKASIGAAVLAIAGIALGGGAISQALITGSMAANASMQLKFSRTDEEEADRLAYKWMKELNRDTEAMASMLGKMYKTSVYQMANIPPYLLTHPEPKRRLGYVQDLLAIDSGSHSQARDPFNFLRIKRRIQVLTKDSTFLKANYIQQLKKNDLPGIDEIMLHYGLALLYADNADFAKSLTEMKLVLEAYPDKAILRSDYGAILFKQGLYDQALDQFEEALRKEPDSSLTAFRLAETYQRLQRQNDALKLYDRLLKVIPDNPALHFQLGQLKTKSGELAAGAYHLGRYFWLEGNVKMAKYHLNKAISVEKDASGPFTAKAQSLLTTIEEIEKES